MLDGKSHKGRPSGGNRQREAFNGKVDAVRGADPMGGKDRTEPPVKGANTGEEGTTTITHHGDGSHTIQHHDGEVSEHPHSGHMLMGLHAKHLPGHPGMHVHEHGGGDGAPAGAGPEHTHSTHHAGADGMVEGPHHHAGVDQAAEHMKSVLGDGAGDGARDGMAGAAQPVEGSGMDLY